jgi:hypothetical protein
MLDHWRPRERRDGQRQGEPEPATEHLDAVAFMLVMVTGMTRCVITAAWTG